MLSFSLILKYLSFICSKIKDCQDCFDTSCVKCHHQNQGFENIDIVFQQIGRINSQDVNYLIKDYSCI